jgi:hypothetical protein
LRYLIAVTVALAAAACTEPAAQQPAATKETAKVAANLPDGWKARLDDPSANADAVRVVADKASLTFTTGPAGFYYKPEMKAEKDYVVSAVFSQLKPTPEPQPYGLFIAGADLDKAAPRYTAFLVRSDGKYQIVTYNGATPTVVVDWTAAPPMRELKGTKTTNTLSVRALQGSLHFLIGEKELHQMPGAGGGTAGMAGVRIGSSLVIQVDKLSVKAFP